MTGRAVGEYTLDDDRGRVDLDALWTFLSTEAYWGRWRSRADVEAQVASAWRVLGAYTADGRLAGFCRASSDGVNTGYLGDVFVLRRHRGRGLGVALVEEMVERGPGARLRWLLHTADAHGLYRRFGFAPPDRTMLERPRPGPDVDEWAADVAAVWAQAGELAEDEVVRRIEELAAVRPGTAEAAFELAGAYDFAGREADAEPLYRAAVAGDLGELDDERRARATLQLASTVRNLGRPDETLKLLSTAVPIRYLEAQTAFRALALLDLGREREAAIAALGSLADRLPVYGRAIGSYVEDLSSD